MEDKATLDMCSQRLSVWNSYCRVRLNYNPLSSFWITSKVTASAIWFRHFGAGPFSFSGKRLGRVSSSLEVIIGTGTGNTDCSSDLWAGSRIFGVDESVVFLAGMREGGNFGVDEREWYFWQGSERGIFGI